MKIFLISDTHNKHEIIELQEADIIIHAGDVTNNGTEKEFLEFIRWFTRLNYEYKIFIAGNHDFYLEKYKSQMVLFNNKTYYLNNSSVIIKNMIIYGFNGNLTNKWAFKLEECQMKESLNKIPLNIDILISHNAPYGILDLDNNGENIGCNLLLEKVKEIKPKYHVFGHIHNQFGIEESDFTKFINCSVLDELMKYKNKKITIKY